MKYLFWLLILLLVWWAVRRARQAARKHAEPAPTPPDTPPMQNMAVCQHCGVHLPREEAVAGARGLYCCVAHRTDAHDRNPD